MPPPRPFGKSDRMMYVAEAATPVEAGALDVVVTVTVTYRARKRAGSGPGEPDPEQGAL